MCRRYLLQQAIERRIKSSVTKNTQSKNLQINESKTEEYKIKREGEKRKKCKYSESLLDTEKDIKKKESICLQLTKTQSKKQV